MNSQPALFEPAAMDGDRLYCLGVTKEGEPRHPLMVRADQPMLALGGA